MKTLITIALLCITISDLWSQIETFAPIGARWHYRPYENMPDIKLYTFTVNYVEFALNGQVRTYKVLKI